MTTAQIRSELDRFVTVLFKSKLAMDSNVHVITQAKSDVVVSWSNEMQLSEVFDSPATLEEYVTLLNKRWFSAVLIDGALLQMSFTLANNTIVKHRLCYHPCPVNFDQRELEDFTLQELVSVLTDSEFKSRLRLEGAVRFDYDIRAEGVDHPPSHLTISRSSCRVPVSSPLSVGHFVRFVFSQFYPQVWKGNAELRTWACSTGDLCLPGLDDDRIFVSWKHK